MHSNVKKIETGQRFGRLTVIAPSTIRYRRQVQFDCGCDCGNRVLALGTNLRNGAKTSCGCLHREKLAEAKFHEIAPGSKFGRLTVVALAVREIGQPAKYLCKCDCGKNVCGLHVETNLRIIAATENLSKALDSIFT